MSLTHEEVIKTPADIIQNLLSVEFRTLHNWYYAELKPTLLRTLHRCLIVSFVIVLTVIEIYSIIIAIWKMNY